MLLAAQNNITKADNIDTGTFSDLNNALKNTTAVGVNLTNDITWTSVIKLGSGTGADKISSDVTINGNNFSIISNNTQHLGLDISKNTNLTINNVSINNFDGNTSWGGALYNSGTLKIENVTFSNNKSQNSEVGGGAIANTEGGIAELNGELGFSNNTNRLCGAAIANIEGGEANLKGNYTFSNNSSKSSGGAIYNSAQMTIESTGKTSFTGNTTAEYSYGGVIWNGENYKFGSGDFTLSWQFDFENNKAGIGGAIYNAANMSIINSNLVETTFKGNSSVKGAGGAIFNIGTLDISSWTGHSCIC